MKDVLEYLDERELEFGRHLQIAQMLEGRVNKSVEDDGTLVEIRHVNTVKSGLIIHLYNIVEAVTTRTMKVVGQTVVTEKPKDWTEAVLTEWVRAEIWNGYEPLGEGAMKKLSKAGSVLASGANPEAFTVKGTPGSWDDDSIQKVAQRLGCPLTVPDDAKRAALEPVYLNQMSAMRFLASRRNAIAHGATTFEDGARDQTLGDIANLAERVFPYLKSVTESYQSFLESRSFLANTGVAA
ncbi:MAG: hypothetical protein AAGL10_06275 [Pseudomonadota bacterium]